MHVGLSEEDKALVEEARRIIARRFREGWHHIGCALRTRSGKTFSAVHLEATVGRIAVCAEAIAIGMAAAAGDTDIESIVAVNRYGEVVPPCGMCRELISDYAPAAMVIVPGKHGEEAVPVVALLPNKYTRNV
ncbi:cytidine deaminase [Thermus islandicus]|uniref:cytidine deaminase n=1 Tax=Thermus islandicus TaxID=540988 RepID=UPI0003B51FBC|nr:cytidine deaminase [Thermus islandicus]